MSIEQWVMLALVIALPLLEGVARLRARTSRSLSVGSGDTAASSEPRRSPHSNRHASESATRAAEKRATPTAPRPPPLPLPASHLDESLVRLDLGKRELFSGLRSSSGPRRRASTPQPDGGVVRWLRPVRNLRRAIVVSTILSRPRLTGEPLQPE